MVTEVQSARVREARPRGGRVPICKAVTFYFPNEKGSDGKIKREEHHTDARCPLHNTGNRTREQLMREFQGRKYSMNTHRID